ncbi:hypothetical protein OG772_05970 [Streptomyces sp. NBC_01321]|uniref:hypothetical protein n=2 Tax=unclassified Streptomyces TaxID=2593676 RepID=UPI002E126E84|nr:hypothetical protein OG772_05970 [Streptomyces sp. NBC_01321]
MTRHIEALSGLLTSFEGSAGDMVDWGVIESAYGTVFPLDYKEFVQRFGHGTIEGGIATLIPVVTSDPMVRRVAPLPDLVRADPNFNRWAERGQVYSLDQIPVWGGGGGGETHSADVLGWVATGADPHAWPLAVWARGDAAWAVHDCGMVEFLIKLLAGDFPEWPISDTSLMGIQNARFLHDRQEERLAEEGIYPWDED